MEDGGSSTLDKYIELETGGRGRLRTTTWGSCSAGDRSASTKALAMLAQVARGPARLPGCVTSVSELCPGRGRALSSEGARATIERAHELDPEEPHDPRRPGPRCSPRLGRRRRGCCRRARGFDRARNSSETTTPRLKLRYRSGMRSAPTTELRQSSGTSTRLGRVPLSQ